MEENILVCYYQIMKKALVIVDYQNDFVDGSLGFKGAELLEDLLIEKINQAVKENSTVIFTKDTHPENYLEIQEGKNLPVLHCIKNTKGWQLYGKLFFLEKEIKDSFTIEKPTFGSLELAKILKDGKFDEVELAGLVSNICVISNAIIAKTALPEALITVDSKATSSFDDGMNKKALDIMKGLQIRIL